MILIVGDGKRVDVAHGIAQVEPLIRERASALGKEVRVDLHDKLDLEQTPPSLVLNFGGDGSILRIVSRLGRRQVPMLGVNFGKFGFLAEYELPELLVRLDDVLDGRLPTRSSLLLLVRVSRGGKSFERVVVNDTVLQRAPDQRMATIHTRYDGQYVAGYIGDGLIVSTPLGSTAYNLASGGPLLEPHLDAVSLTPLAPHMLSLRPLVVPAGGLIRLTLEGSDTDTILTMDGAATHTLAEGDWVEIERAPMPMTLIAHPTRSYFDTLRLKFDWNRRGTRTQ
jgi:NAD+ kinase